MTWLAPIVRHQSRATRSSWHFFDVQQPLQTDINAAIANRLNAAFIPRKKFTFIIVAFPITAIHHRKTRESKEAAEQHKWHFEAKVFRLRTTYNFF